MPGKLPRALFVCIHNAGRSQMARAFWEEAGGEGRSAGSNPGMAVNLVVAQAMREVGLDIQNRVPHRLDQEDMRWADVVVTMGCGDACPYVPGKPYFDWELEDPAGQDLVAVRRIRDEIRARIRALADPS